MATASASAAEPASIAATDDQRPADLWLLGSDRLLLGAEAGRQEIQSSGRPSTRFRERPAGRLLFTLWVLGLTVLAIILVIIICEKARGGGIF